MQQLQGESLIHTLHIQKKFLHVLKDTDMKREFTVLRGVEEEKNKTLQQSLI